MCYGWNIIFFMLTSGSCNVLGFPVWSQILEANSSPLVQHSQMIGIHDASDVSALRTKKKARHFQSNTDDPVICDIVITQSLSSCLYILHENKMNPQLSLNHLNHHCVGEYSLTSLFSYRCTVLIQLGCRSEFSITLIISGMFWPPATTKSTAKIHFL